MNEPTPDPGPESGQTPGSELPPRSESTFGPRTWRRFFSLKRILLVLLGLFVLGAGVVGVAFAMTAVPSPNEVATAQASIIYYADGKTEMYRISKVNREIVPFTQIPVHVQKALLAAEDRSFYTEHGVSPTGIGRALVVALKGGPTQGGSTITQQYVKNYFLTADRTVSRKAKEFIISIKIDQSETKDTILANYLNTIYYGRGAYGIQTASKAYFGKDVSRLTVSEGALLASVIRGPAFYDPGLGPKQKALATARWNYVLDGMVAQGWLTPQARAKATFPKTKAKVKVSRAGTVGYVVQAVTAELKSKTGLKDADIERGGLRIVTTIDKKSQDAAVKAVNDKMPPQYFDKVDAKTKNQRDEQLKKALHVGLTAIRPGDGAIVALYGGKDYSQSPYNAATQATNQAGSTFKVFGLLAALQKNISTKTMYDGYSPQFFKAFVDPKANPPDLRGEVPNFGDESFGRVDLRTALAHSVNTVFAHLNVDLAAPGNRATGTRDAAILAGLPKGTKGLSDNINNILGTASPRAIDMANAYATVAAQGKRATPYIIKSATSKTLGINYKATKDLKTVFSKDVTADVTDAMTQVVQYGTGSKANAMGRPAAGKTGTTNDSKAAWFDGFTPQLAAAVVMYQGEVPTTIKVNNFYGEVTGGTFPLDIWTAFMEGALQGQPVLPFPQRVGVGDNALPPPPAPPTQKPTPTPSTTTATPTPSTTTPTPTFTRPRPTRSHPTPTFTQTGPPTGPPTTAAVP
jgi:membrane peptidoglycan carboxypeptidase